MLTEEINKLVYKEETSLMDYKELEDEPTEETSKLDYNGVQNIISQFTQLIGSSRFSIFFP